VRTWRRTSWIRRWRHTSKFSTTAARKSALRC